MTMIGPSNSIWAPAIFGRRQLPWRQVATSTYLPESFFGSNKQIMSRSPHIAQDDISSLRIGIPNWYLSGANGATETGTGGTESVTGSIEYPSGTFAQLKFSGATTGVIPDLGTLISDEVSVSIPSGSRFWVRLWVAGQGTLYFNRAGNTANGQALNFGVTTTDLTMGGTVTNAGNYSFSPCLILARTSVKSAYLIGDSRVWGLSDTYTSAGHRGQIAPSLAAEGVAYTNAARSGDTITAFLASSTRRIDLSQYHTHVIGEIGAADLRGGIRTPEQVIEGITDITGLLGIPALWCTFTPLTDSSDSWATTANQSDKTGNPERITANDDIRAGVPGTTGYFEIADVVESARNSGKWKVDGTANKYTADGVHETTFANAEIASSGVITAAALT